MLYKPTYASPHLIAYDIPVEEITIDGVAKTLPRLTFEFGVSGNNCIGYKIYIKNIKDDAWTDLSNDSLVVSFGEKATPITKQVGSTVNGIDAKGADGIFILNATANNEDRIIFDAFIEGYKFEPNETYQWKVQLYDDSYLEASGYSVHKVTIETNEIYKEQDNGQYIIKSRKYARPRSVLGFLRVGMSIRQWVSEDSPLVSNTDNLTPRILNKVAYYPIIRKITGIKYSVRNVYIYVDSQLETQKQFWMPCDYGAGYALIDVLQTRTLNKEYSFVGYGVIQGVSSKITLQKHYNVRPNMMLFFGDKDDSDTEHITIQNPSVNEVEQNMTIDNPGNLNGDYKGRYYKIYSYFVESDSYTFEYNESPSIDFTSSVNKEENLGDNSYNLKAKFPSETFVGTYNHSTEEIVSYSFEVKCEGETVAKSGEIYSANINFTVDGLIDGKTYTVAMSIVDTKNRTVVIEKSYAVQYIGKVLDRKDSKLTATYTNQKFCVLLENCLYTSNSGGEKKREHMVLYRLSPNSLLMERVIEQSFDESEFKNDMDVIADYKIGNELDYQYVAFSDVQICSNDYATLFDENDPSQEKWEENSEIWISTCYIRSSPIVHIDCDSYVVMELVPIDAADTEVFSTKRYRPKTLWTFELNLEEGNRVQNLSKEQYLTLSNYPKISKTKRNYVSSSLSCYIGGIDMYEDYIDNKSLIDKWEEFCASDSKKVLKDTKGNLFEIEVLNPQYKNELTAFRIDKNGYRQSPTTIQFDWVQTGDMDKEAISVSGHARTIGELDTLSIDELDGKTIFDVSYKWEFDDIPIPENKNGKRY